MFVVKMKYYAAVTAKAADIIETSEAEKSRTEINLFGFMIKCLYDYLY